MGSAFGAEAGASPVGNKTEALAGTTGTGKGGGSGAWELPVGAAEDGRSGPSEGLQPAVPSLGLKKSRSDCSFCEEMESVSEQRVRRDAARYPWHRCWGPYCRPTGLAAEDKAPEGKGSGAAANCS